MAKKTNYNKKKGSNQPKSVQGTAKNTAAAGKAATAKKGTAAGNGTAGKAAAAGKSATGKRAPVKSKVTDTPLHWAYMLPVALVFSIVPLIACYIKHKTNLTDFDWFTPAGEAAEFFLYYKMVALIIIGVYLVAALIAKGVFFEEKLPWQKLMVPLAIYTVLVILSTVFSPYKEYSLNGSYEQFEPVWVLVTYSLLTYYCYANMNSEKRVKRVMMWMLVGVSVMCLLGLSQVLKHDFFRTNLGQQILAGPNYEYDVKIYPLIFNFELGRVYATLYNPNYVGSYVVLFVPPVIAMLTKAKKWSERIFYVAVEIGLLACLFGSQSRAGIVGVVVSLISLAILERKYLAKNWKVSLLALFLLIAAFIGVDTFNGHVLSARLKELTVKSPAEAYTLRGLYTNDDNFTVDYNGNQMVIRMQPVEETGGLGYGITDGEGNEIACTVDENGTAVVSDERFPGFTLYNVMLQEEPAVYGSAVTIDGQPWYFTNTYGDGTYYLFSNTGRFMKLSHPEGTPYLEEHYHALNMRGYIWSKTIPLLKKYLFLGSGADTFIIAFPNDDLVGMYNSGHVNEIITRPHCWYLQMAVNTGVLSLICYLVFYLMYLIQCIKLYWKAKEDTYLSKLGAAIACASLGYMCVGIINDSIVCVAPLFWSLLGVGLAINAKIAGDRKEQIAPDEKL